MYMFEGHKGSTTLQGFRLLCSDFGPICIWNAQAHFQVGDLLSIQLGKWRMIRDCANLSFLVILWTEHS